MKYRIPEPGDLITKWNHWYSCGIIQKVEDNFVYILLVANANNPRKGVTTGTIISNEINSFKQCYFYDVLTGTYNGRQR